MGVGLYARSAGLPFWWGKFNANQLAGCIAAQVLGPWAGLGTNFMTEFGQGLDQYPMVPNLVIKMKLNSN